MTIGELKRSLTRFPSDMDDTEILLTYLDTNKKEEYDLLSFVSYTETLEDTCIVLGSLGVAQHKLKKGTLKFADGSKPNVPPSLTD